MNLLVHHGISDLYKTLGLPFEQEIEFTILSIPDIHSQIPFISPNLRADYFSFILTKDGSGIYYLDENKFPFGPGTFYFTNPGHIKSYELHEVNEWISKKTLSVAKSLLLSTFYSSKEIAYKLGFSEPTHFSRFFKSHAQLSPNAFRKSKKLMNL